MQNILEKIVSSKREEVAKAKKRRPLGLIQALAEATVPPRGFLEAVSWPSPQGIHIIAEIKKASPSAGLIVADFDPAVIAEVYASSGASAISVLTDEPFFQGHLDYIQIVHDACDLPILRKDFMVDTYQVYEARAAGADAILLIAEVLTADEIANFIAEARKAGMDCLVELHDPANLDSLLDVLGPPGIDHYLLGINNRDLSIQKTDINTTVLLAERLPDGTPFVSESGITTREHVRTVAEAGACAVLVGESLLREADPGRKLRELLGIAEGGGG